MGNVIAMYKREMKSYFVSPVAYIILTVFFLIAGFFFYHSIEMTRAATVSGVLGDISVILLFMVPFVTMPLIAEEKKSGTIEMLFTSPVSPFQVVLAKYLAALTVIAIAVVGLMFYVVVLLLHAPMELGPVICGYLGLLLFGSALVAVGLFASTIANSQIGAGIFGFGISVFLFLITRIGYSGKGFINKLFQELSPLTHYVEFTDGLFDLKHVIFFLLWAVLCVSVSTKILEARLLK